MPIRILLADDHPLLRSIVRRLLDMQDGLLVVATVADGQEAVDVAAQLRPAVAVLDLELPRLDGIQAAWTIREISPETRILMFSSHSDPEYVNRARQAGALGYVHKERVDDLVPAVLAVAAGQQFFSKAVYGASPQAADSNPMAPAVV